MRCGRPADPRRGSALLAVLWLSIALSAIAFALSRSVRTEFERAAVNVDATRAYFLAQGAIERAMMHMLVQPDPDPGRPPRGFRQGQRLMRFAFPGGVADVEIIGESGKININRASPEALTRLLAATGLDPSEAVAAAVRIVEARSRSPWSGVGLQESANLAALSSFSTPRTSFQELEELLMVPGVTPNILFGTYRRDDRGELERVGGLYRHATLIGGGGINANYASPEVLRAAGLPPPLIDTILAIRAQRPLRHDDPGMADLPKLTNEIRVGISGGSAYTLRATARLRTGRAVRTVAALVQMAESPEDLPIQLLRWYDIDF